LLLICFGLLLNALVLPFSRWPNDFLTHWLNIFFCLPPTLQIVQSILAAALRATPCRRQSGATNRNRIDSAVVLAAVAFPWVFLFSKWRSLDSHALPKFEA
jgi:hypothetical protein